MAEFQSHNPPIKCFWYPAWHELDQPLQIGAEQVFHFFDNRAAPPDFEVPADCDLVFWNRLLTAEPGPVSRLMRVEQITHEVLGPLVSVSTSGLDYVFQTVDGNEWIVNAEEAPGTPYDMKPEIERWALMVTMSEIPVEPESKSRIESPSPPESTQGSEGG